MPLFGEVLYGFVAYQLNRPALAFTDAALYLGSIVAT